MVRSLFTHPEKEDSQAKSDTTIQYSKLSRRDIRALIFHLLYAAEVRDYDVSLEAIIDDFNRGFDLDVPIESDTCIIAKGVIAERKTLDAIYEKLLTNWRLDRVSMCTRLVLRLGFWELIHTDIDHRIIINEAIELAKCFAEDDAYRFINGLLDRAVKEGLIPGRSVSNDKKEDA